MVMTGRCFGDCPRVGTINTSNSTCRFLYIWVIYSHPYFGMNVVPYPHFLLFTRVPLRPCNCHQKFNTVGGNGFLVLPSQSKALPLCCPSLPEMNLSGEFLHSGVKRPSEWFVRYFRVFLLHDLICAVLECTLRNTWYDLKIQHLVKD